MARIAGVLILFCLMSSTFLVPPANCIATSLDKDGPSWWEVKLVLDSKGNYRIREGFSSYPGNYSFSIVWTGFMEKDNGDYILYHEDSKLLHWEAQELLSNPDALTRLFTYDFSGKPTFNMNYVLKREGNIYFDFSVKGFPIPQNESEQKFYLNFPVSEENSEHFSGIDYDLCVFKGSNCVFLPEQKIQIKSVNKDFSWKWKYQGWQIGSEKAAYLSHTHEVKVKIFIIPHFKKR